MTLFRIVLLLHIASAIVGFGGIITHALYNNRAHKAPAEVGKALIDATQSITNIAHYGLYGLFVFGIAAVALNDGILMSATWVSASFVVWFIIVGVAHGLVRPAVRGLAERSAELTGQETLAGDSAAAPLVKKLALGDGITELLLVVALVLMIWQPGN